MTPKKVPGPVASVLPFSHPPTPVKHKTHDFPLVFCSFSQFSRPLKPNPELKTDENETTSKIGSIDMCKERKST